MTQPTPIRRVAGSRPRLLDAFCCQGGAAKGYADAGFDVTGIDLNPQPRYPYTFVQGDAVEYIRAHGHEYDAIHASPPCQHDSECQRIQGRTHPDHPAHTVPQAKMGRPIPPGHYGHYVGNFSGVDRARHVLGVPWMNRDGIRECIPPAYAAWVGHHALTHLNTRAEVAA
ncbi:methyltransferase domain-containing protein [Streptomyces diastaticus]|uniref:SAM-dependent methyltransferase n=1 Tax=Streptomyces diastaticus TaxID=1956 RepID=UPI0035DDFE1E